MTIISPTKASGGYILAAIPLVRTGFTRHTAALDRPVSPVSVHALNVVQSTPWRINTWILDIAQEAFTKGIALPGVGQAKLPPPPPRLEDAVWAALPDADRAAHSAKRRDAHKKRAKARGKFAALVEKLMVAERLRTAERLWFPHTLDFRGRMYPIPTYGPHPQGDDLGRALIHFAEGLPLGDDGLYWLCIRAANTFGHDKLPLEARVGWTVDNQEMIFQAASDPFGSTWWSQADDPWSFLATCRELSMAFQMPNRAAFVSHLPVPMDGSCNGIQNLSAMALDPIGAKATNLLPGPRQDIYEDVAKHVEAVVEEDAAKGIAEALHWHGRVTRKVVKRATMTTPYGVTDRGIRQQLIKDGNKPENEWFEGCSGTKEAADYMRDRIVDALSSEVGAAKAIMEWLQTTAKRLAEAGHPFEWTTPTGSRVRQAYTGLIPKRIETLSARLSYFVETDVLVPNKQAQGSAPNFVHSFDAAHLSMTVAAARDEGIESFAMIHDSYGTHAGKTTKLARILREQFVEIHKRDWIGRLYGELRERYPNVAIPEPPARGTFDITQVLDSAFFFS